jgi:acyl-CoA synthetase (AMP-forming)/AMP-acid ligase II/acyl carrier protein
MTPGPMTPDHMTPDPITPDPTTPAALVRAWSRTAPDRVAILAPGMPALTYRELHRRVGRSAGALTKLGLPREARVGVALPQGPELAVTLLAVCSAATCAPLRPDSPPAQLAREAAQLGLDVVVTAADQADDLRDLGVPMVTDLRGPLPPARPGGDGSRPAGPKDIALLLRTSGTTGQAKRVPLTQANLGHAIRNIRRSLRLTADDRCLNVMPLWHVHGFVAGLLAPLAAGGSVVCPPAFSATAFPGWLSWSEATWYTAAPAVHQAVVEVLGQTGVPPHRLRFVRSASSRLPSTVAARLEETFGVPAIEAYGMTEATHQIAASPLPPAVRKRGSVGIGAGVDIAVRGARGERLPPGAEGEIIIRGGNVFGGYDGDASSSSSFIDGWFRTGDRGRLDSDGHLYLTGRIKEMINRGGETIAPREIEDALLEHPDIVDAASFGIPHRRLGETVGAAVVVRAGVRLTEIGIRKFAGTRLSPSKVPSRVTFIQEIPRGATGKLRRAELDRRLADPRTRPEEPSRPPADLRASGDILPRLTAGWAHLLGTDDVGPDDSLADLGGDSLLSARMANRVEAWFGVRVPPVDFFLADTVAEQAELIRTLLTEAPGFIEGRGVSEPD